MHKPKGNKLHRALPHVAAMALIASLAIPGAALAQDPAADQYAPTTPSGGGNVPSSPTPDTSSAPGNGPGAAGTAAGAGADAGAGSAATTADGGQKDSSGRVAADGGGDRGDGSAGGGTGGNGSNGASSGDAAGVGAQPAGTELVRSNNSSGSGMGIFLWIVIGAAVLWAVASGVVNYRRRGGEPGSGHGRDGSQTA